MEEIKSILLSLLKNNESENVEYKEAKNNFDFNELGRYFSALSNGANLIGKQYAWLIFGVSDKSHDFVNTNYRRNSNLNGLKKELTQSTNDNLTFLDIYELEIDGNRVIMFKIPAAIGVPTTWKGIAYDRNDDALIPLNDTKRNTILSTVNIDWSRQIVEDRNKRCHNCLALHLLADGRIDIGNILRIVVRNAEFLLHGSDNRLLLVIVQLGALNQYLLAVVARLLYGRWRNAGRLFDEIRDDIARKVTCDLLMDVKRHARAADKINVHIEQVQAKRQRNQSDQARGDENQGNNRKNRKFLYNRKSALHWSHASFFFLTP